MTQPSGFEYKDHTADVQIHSWGSDVKEAFQQAVLGMFGYIIENPLSSIDIDEDFNQTVEAEGHDLDSLLYSFMDEYLFLFATEFFVAKEVRIMSLKKDEEGNYKIKSQGFGEKFDKEKHGQGTEIKAITYSNMQIHEKEGKAEVFVIVDI